MDVLQLMCFIVLEWITKVFLACVWHEGEHFYTAGPVAE